MSEHGWIASTMSWAGSIFSVRSRKIPIFTRGGQTEARPGARVSRRPFPSSREPGRARVSQVAQRAVDNGHLVGWSASMPYEMRMAASGGSMLRRMGTSAASGEGLMCFFTGPGTIWLQTHKPPPPEAPPPL